MTEELKNKITDIIRYHRDENYNSLEIAEKIAEVVDAESDLALRWLAVEASKKFPDIGCEYCPAVKDCSANPKCIETLIIYAKQKAITGRHV